MLGWYPKHIKVSFQKVQKAQKHEAGEAVQRNNGRAKSKKKVNFPFRDFLEDSAVPSYLTSHY